MQAEIDSSPTFCPQEVKRAGRLGPTIKGPQTEAGRKPDTPPMAAAAEIKDTKKNCPKGQLGMYKYVYIYTYT